MTMASQFTGFEKNPTRLLNYIICIYVIMSRPRRMDQCFLYGREPNLRHWLENITNIMSAHDETGSQNYIKNDLQRLRALAEGTKPLIAEAYNELGWTDKINARRAVTCIRFQGKLLEKPISRNIVSYLN